MKLGEKCAFEHNFFSLFERSRKRLLRSPKQLLQMEQKLLNRRFLKGFICKVLYMNKKSDLKRS
ncbi:hypothetical protein, partial [Photobacterium sanctipauli]